MRLSPLALSLGCARPAIGDPVTRFDRYDGPSFSELLEVQVHGDRVAFCSGVQGLNLSNARNPARLRFLDRIGFSARSAHYPRCQHLAWSADGTRIWVSSHA